MTVEQEVRRILSDMRAAAIATCDIKAERETTEMVPIVLADPFMQTIPSTEALTSLYAQAVITRAWCQVANHA